MGTLIKTSALGKHIHQLCKPWVDPVSDNRKKPAAATEERIKPPKFLDWVAGVAKHRLCNFEVTDMLTETASDHPDSVPNRPMPLVVHIVSAQFTAQ